MSKNLPSIFSSSDAPLATVNGGQRIATRMAENLLGMACSQERALAAQRRYHIGDYEFREADHAQIQRWARMLGMEPEQVVEVLASSQKEQPFAGITTTFDIEDGRIVSLVWDFAILPLTDWAWIRGLQVERLAILNAPQEPLPRLPECLCELICEDNPITSLTLTNVPLLKKLNCRENRLTELDLTLVPMLQVLWCEDNQLTALDLRHVPRLEFLLCCCNQLADLDLSPVPRLDTLAYSNNKLAALCLKLMPELQFLQCDRNRLTELDLTPVPGLQCLSCRRNQLTSLDLTPVPLLEDLYCSMNQLTELDLTPVPRLQNLWCYASLNITGAPPNLNIYRV